MAMSGFFFISALPESFPPPLPPEPPPQAVSAAAMSAVPASMAWRLRAIRRVRLNENPSK